MDNKFFPNYPALIVTSKYGMRDHPVDGVYKMHSGVDIVATRDGKTGQVDLIQAHTGGIVDAVGYTDTVGYYINIRVDARTVMVYRHLRDMPTLKKGEAVKTGDIIGIMGMTGNATGRHLHWGIKVDGSWIDPAPYLDADYPVEQGAKTVALELPVLKQGAKGDAVKAMQILLAGYGYKDDMKESAYGSFGGKTDKALRRYQQEHGLSVDGSCGPATWASLMGLEGG